MCGIGISLKALPLRPHHTQTLRCTDPDAVLLVDVQNRDGITQQTVFPLRIKPPHAEFNAVVAGQAVGGADPQVALPVFGDLGDAGADVLQPCIR